MAEGEILKRAAVLIFSLLGLFSLIHIVGSRVKRTKVQWKRLVSQLFLYVILFGVLALPPIFLAALLASLIFLGVGEIYRAVRVKDPELYVRPLEIYSRATVIWVPFLLQLFPEFFPFFLVANTIVLVSIPIFAREPTRYLAKTIPPILCIVFAYLLSMLLWVRSEPDGLAWCILLIFLTSAADSTAYVFGKIWGARPLAPALSPMKTVEGTGVSVLSCVLIALVARYWFLPLFPIWKVILSAVIISLGAHLGDLICSVYKRDAGIKDYGNLIPGHGGILDRFDSLLIATPIFYYFLKLTEKF